MELVSVPPWLVIASWASDAERPAARRTSRVVVGPAGVVVVVGGIVVEGGAVVVVGGTVDVGVVVSGAVVSGAVVSGVVDGVVLAGGVADESVGSENAIVAGAPTRSTAVIATTSARMLPLRNRCRRPRAAAHADARV